MSSKQTLKQLLLHHIPTSLHQYVPRSFEVIGTIAIIEIDDTLKEFELIIANTLLKKNSQIKTVVKKATIHKGEFRTQQFEFLSGINTTITQYRENGILIELDINSVYFSTKLSTEREILAKEVKESSNQLVLFSGTGPYSFVISKYQPNISRITSIELNPQGHNFALKNLQLNKNNLRKNKQFQKLYQIIKQSNIKIYEKELMQSFNNLTYQFLNVDAKNYSPLLQQTKKNTKNIEQKIDNSLLEIDIDKIHSLVNEKQITSLVIDYNTLKEEEKEKLQLLLLLFYSSISITLIYEKKIYEIKSNLEKNYLFQLLDNSNKTLQEIIKYDKIYMPLPKTAINFLEYAYFMINPGGIIHLYSFMSEEEIEKEKLDPKIFEFARNTNKDISILQVRKIGQSSPRVYRVCIDIEVKN